MIRGRCGHPRDYEVDDDDCDIVGPTPLIGEVDEGLASGVGVGIGARTGEARSSDPGDLVVIDYTVEPIGGEEEGISPAEVVVGEIDIDLRVGPEGLEDDMAFSALGGLFGGELAGLDECLDAGLVAGELVRGAATDEVGPRVPDLGDVELVAEDPGCGGRSEERRVGQEGRSPIATA